MSVFNFVPSLFPLEQNHAGKARPEKERILLQETQATRMQLHQEDNFSTKVKCDLPKRWRVREYVNRTIEISICYLCGMFSTR